MTSFNMSVSARVVKINKQRRDKIRFMYQFNLIMFVQKAQAVKDCKIIH